MALAICPQCQRRFVIEGERSFQRTCPACLRPMQLGSQADVASPTSEPPGEDGHFWFNGTPLASDELGQRVMAALAEAAYQCAVLEAQRQAWSERRGKAAPSADAEGVQSPSLAPEGQEEPPRGPGQQARNYSASSVTLIEQAEQSCIQAQIVQSRYRRVQEMARFSHDPLGLLPPLDYQLPPLTLSSMSLAKEAASSWLPLPDDLALALPYTILYFWGYDLPTSLLCRQECEASAAAAQFATESGWDESREGAWAKAITLPRGLCETLREWEPLLRQDPAVVGWGVRMEHRRTVGHDM